MKNKPNQKLPKRFLEIVRELALHAAVLREGKELGLKLWKPTREETRSFKKKWRELESFGDPKDRRKLARLVHLLSKEIH